MGISDFINAKIEAGVLEPKMLRAFATIEGFKDSEISEDLKSRGMIRSKANGLTFPDVLDWLAEKPRTELELAEFLLTECTKNEARWFNDRNKIRLVINRVFIGLGKTFTEEYADSKKKEDLKNKGK